MAIREKYRDGFCIGVVDSIRDTWPQIIQSTKDGSYRERYHIGDTKLLRLGSLGDICMQIAAFDADDLVDGGKAATTWIAEDLLIPGHRMNPSLLPTADGCYVRGSGSIGGFFGSEMRQWLRGTVMSKIPEEVQREIKPVLKVSMSRTVQNVLIQLTTTETLWLPSHREVFGGDTVETVGVVYSELFPDAASRRKANIGSSSAFWWWLRSAYYTDFFNIVNSDGSNYYSNANGSIGVALGFCI